MKTFPTSPLCYFHFHSCIIISSFRWANSSFSLSVYCLSCWSLFSTQPRNDLQFRLDTALSSCSSVITLLPPFLYVQVPLLLFHPFSLLSCIFLWLENMTQYFFRITFSLYSFSERFIGHSHEPVFLSFMFWESWSQYRLYISFSSASFHQSLHCPSL